MGMNEKWRVKTEKENENNFFSVRILTYHNCRGDSIKEAEENYFFESFSDYIDN